MVELRQKYYYYDVQINKFVQSKSIWLYLADTIFRDMKAEDQYFD